MPGDFAERRARPAEGGRIPNREGGVSHAARLFSLRLARMAAMLAA